MHLPPYYVSRPRIDLTAAARDQFEALFSQAIREGSGNLVEYTCPVPKWQFLCYLGDQKDALFHGSGDPAISEFEPRQSDDVKEFGNQRAVYAASDALWSMYYAIVDRPRYVRSLVNSCDIVVGSDGKREHYYFFSVNEDALRHRPWRSGTIYVLPRKDFEQEESSKPGRESAQWRSFVPVKPLAKVSVEPDDFPFLDKIRGHDVETVVRRAREDPDAFPWLDEQVRQ